MDKFGMTENGKKYGRIALIILAVYLGMKYISPIVSPFIFAFLLAGLINPFVSKVHRKMKIKKTLLAGLIVFLLIGLITFILWLLFTLLWTEGRNFACQLPDLEKEFGVLLKNCCCGLEDRFGIDGIVIENFILEQVNVLVENLEVKVLPAVMGKSFDYIKGIAGGISFFVVMMIAVLLITKDYGELLERIKAEKGMEGVFFVCKKVIFYVKTFIKAQLLLLLIISAICAITLWLIGMKGGITYGLLTGFMDMLPFVGTGIMLIPLAIFMALNGSIWQAAVCLMLYAVCVFTRELLEPKLIGERVGVWPVGILFSVFAGIYLFGIWGIIKGPLSLVIICETCKYLQELQKIRPMETP